MHDYTEDALRGLIDKVSFRQNLFVIIVAAQTLLRFARCMAARLGDPS